MKPSTTAVAAEVRAALDEDLGSGDVSAALIDPGQRATARLITRSDGVLAGSDWTQAAFTLLDPSAQVRWHAADGERVASGDLLCQIEAQARAILSAERTALNFLQLLSGVATRTATYVEAVAGTGARILDTRKTLPGLRAAEKYAVRVGGGHNHRLGLHDMVMLKENHIAAAGSIAFAVARARALWPGLTVEVETERLDQLEEALAAGADRIMLDNFTLDQLTEAVALTQGRAVLEASGGIDLGTIRAVAETGVDDISVGELTKRIDPIDLSLRIQT